MAWLFGNTAVTFFSPMYLQELRMGGNHLQAAQVSEQELITRILQGERRLFHELVRPYERAVFLIVNAILRNGADAEEAAQETMIKALTKLDQLTDSSKFKSWLLQIAANEARLKRRHRHDSLFESLDGARVQSEGDFMPRDFADWREIPSEALERKETREAITRALQDLAPIYREIFILRDVEQLDIAQCSELLSVSGEVVRTRLHRARLMMREQLTPHFRRGWLDRIFGIRGTKPW